MAQETMISEGEVPAYLDEFVETALTHMEKEDFEAALSYLSKSEELLEAVAVQAEEEGSMPFISFEEVFLLPLSETFEMTSSNSLEI